MKVFTYETIQLAPFLLAGNGFEPWKSSKKQSIDLPSPCNVMCLFFVFVFNVANYHCQITQMKHEQTNIILCVLVI
jgi:hypothetical protein